MKKFSEFYHDINGEFRENFPLANLTWFKVGGPAQMLFIPENKDDLVKFIKKCPVKYPKTCLLYTSPSPRDKRQSRMPSSA